jgi:CHAT domain-containing protein
MRSRNHRMPDRQFQAWHHRLGRSALRLGLLFILAWLGVLLFSVAAPAIAPPSFPIKPAASSPPLAAAPLPTAAAPTDPIQQSKDLFDQGRYAEAATLLEQAVQAYRRQNNPAQEAAAWANLSLVYQQLGDIPKATGAIAQSLTLLQTPNLAVSQRSLLGQALDIQGRLQLNAGDNAVALQTWQRAEQVYRQIGDANGVAKAKLNQAQALRAQGFYRRALQELTSLSAQLQPQPDSRLKLLTLRILGETEQLVGDLERSEQALKASLALTQRLNLPHDSGAALLGLGNLARVQQNPTAAIAYYQQAATTSPQPLTQLQSQLNHLNLLIDLKRWSETQPLVAQLTQPFDRLPPTRAGVFARLSFAQSLVRLGAAKPGAANYSALLEQTLKPAIAQARTLGDTRAESYGLGLLGAAYEQTGQYPDALEVTRQALVLAQSSTTWDVAYRWHWQLGRLLRQTGDTTGAIAAYDNALANLQALRGDLTAINNDAQFSFREGVEPIYRQSVELMLTAAQQGDSSLLEKARERIEALQLAELDNFFREACLEGRRVLLDQVVDRDNPTTAILYPIVLRNPQQQTINLQVIAKIPGQPLQRHATTLPSREFDATVNDLRLALATAAPTAANQAKVRANAQKLYTWLLAPVEQALQASNDQTKQLPATSGSPPLKAGGVDTLVFVLDDALRNIPMAVLWDGQQYLVEKYAVSVSLGLQLLNPTPIAREPLKVLAGALQDPPKGAPPELGRLQYAKSEVAAIAQLGIPTQELLEQNFTSTALQTTINTAPFNVVHLATHGKFSSRAEDTFILAADGPVNVADFDSLLRSRDLTRSDEIELLVLSACQTAAGDDRAALGLAGFAVRAGARSTLASLWNVSDRSTPFLIREFYQQLTHAKQPITKAEALRRAQLALLRDDQYRNYRAPQDWAPFVLIGNWL